MSRYLSAITALIVVLLSGACNNAAHDSTVINGVEIPSLLPRKNAADTGAEFKTIRETFDKSLAALKAHQNDPKAYLGLATVYILEGRSTGNNSYYSNAAIRVLNQVIDGEERTQDERFQALSLKSGVLLNLHQFPDALAVAKEGLAINDFNAGIYGALIDANVELGHYDEAVRDCDKMLSIRPDLRSYSRASYLRQIYGDNQGAIEAMKMAVEAGVPGAEQTEWARANLGDLYLNTGKLDSASFTFRSSLVYRPGYPFAEVGLAKVYKAQKNYDTAIVLTKNAIRTLGESSFVGLLADLYELKGDTKKAAEVRQDVINLLEESAKDEKKEGVIAHNGNRELANAYLAAGNYDKALAFAKKDYEMRPDNIEANELMAWISYKKNDFNAAKAYAEKSMATHSRNASMLYKNSLIFAKAGETMRSDTTRLLAMRITPYIDQQLVSTSNR